MTLLRLTLSEDKRYGIESGCTNTVKKLWRQYKAMLVKMKN
jgi:hypothetical protein